MTLSIVNEKLLFILSVPFIQPEKITPLNERKSHSRGIKKDVLFMTLKENIRIQSILDQLLCHPVKYRIE
jgi:hypothetical protein